MSDDDPYAEIVRSILDDDDESWMAVDWASSLWANWHTLSDDEKRNYVARLVDLADGEYELPQE